jgi:hypothetical protein
MIRRMRNPAFRSNPLGPLQMQTLSQANRHLANRQPLQAAALYSGLASEMEAQNHPRRAANLHAQAAHAYADGRDEQASLAQARSALKLFIQYQMTRRTPVFYATISSKFSSNGMTEAAEILTKDFSASVDLLPTSNAFPAQPHNQLPTNCPKCGAPIHAEEANWVDKLTVECDFCGSQIRTE